MTIRKPKVDEVVRVVEIRGIEYISIANLAKMYDMSYNKMVEVIASLQQTHEVRVLSLGERLTRVNFADFRRALLDRATLSTQLVKSV